MNEDEKNKLQDHNLEPLPKERQEPLSEIKEECKELTPRSELSGITDNNISENDFVVPETHQTRKKDTGSAFIEKHEILPRPS